MKIVYNSERFQINAYGTEPVYLVLDKERRHFVACEGRMALELRALLNDPLPDIATDIGIEGMVELIDIYNEAMK